MQLSPRELERLTVFTAAELARRRIRDEVPLSHPDCVALASDVVMEAARAGAGYEQAASAAHGLLTPEQLAPGVAELLAATPLQVEASFGDGSRLVPLGALVADGGADRDEHAAVPGEVVVGDGDAPEAATETRSAVVRVSNRGRFDAYLTSHFPIAAASPSLEFDREGLEGARPVLPAGASVAIPAGESMDVPIRWD